MGEEEEGERVLSRTERLSSLVLWTGPSTSHPHSTAGLLDSVDSVDSEIIVWYYCSADDYWIDRNEW